MGWYKFWCTPERTKVCRSRWSKPLSSPKVWVQSQLKPQETTNIVHVVSYGTTAQATTRLGQSGPEWCEEVIVTGTGNVWIRYCRSQFASFPVSKQVGLQPFAVGAFFLGWIRGCFDFFFHFDQLLVMGMLLSDMFMDRTGMLVWALVTDWAFVALIVWGATLFCRGLFRGGHFKQRYTILPTIDRIHTSSHAVSQIKSGDISS